jgi:hypothetical protein
MLSILGKAIPMRYMTNGTVKRFNGQKGYGFIQPDDGGKDGFVHIRAVERAGSIASTKASRSFSTSSPIVELASTRSRICEPPDECTEDRHSRGFGMGDRAALAGRLVLLPGTLVTR